LSDEEEAKLDEIINRFIDFDSGKLKGTDGKQIVADFNKLGPDAIPALIRGINRAAEIEHSCPAVTIAKKLARLFRSSNDAELLEFARENIGAGIEHSRHLGVLKDLRFQCLVRKRAVAQAGTAASRSTTVLRGDTTAKPDPARQALRTLTLSQLVEASGKERGPKLKLVLTELGNRGGDAAVGALGSAAATYDGDVQKLARELLDKQLAKLALAALKEKFKEDRAEVRAAACRVAASKSWHLERSLIDLLTDEEVIVRQAAHASLVKLSNGTDLGPRAGADEQQRKQAVQKWLAWLEQQNGR
jgi:hypothetical protein